MDYNSILTPSMNLCGLWLSEQLNPMIIPPDILRNILQEVQNDIRTNARLKLPDDPVTKIWSYYGMTKLTPIVLGGLSHANIDYPLGGQFFTNEFVQSA